MTPSQQAKEYGLKSLAEVGRMTKQSQQTLINWHKNKPELFDVVLQGCVTRKFHTFFDGTGELTAAILAEDGKQ